MFKGEDTPINASFYSCADITSGRDFLEMHLNTSSSLLQHKIINIFLCVIQKGMIFFLFFFFLCGNFAIAASFKFQTVYTEEVILLLLDSLVTKPTECKLQLWCSRVSGLCLCVHPVPFVTNSLDDLGAPHFCTEEPKNWSETKDSLATMWDLDGLGDSPDSFCCTWADRHYLRIWCVD